jgi:hypothetical protein
MNRAIIKKIPLDDLIEILTDLYNRGVDYIDMLAPEDPTEDDRMTITFTKEYMSEEALNSLDEEDLLADDEEDILDIKITANKLSDDDLNQLL